jgi:ABC-2 type transport system permease protein
MVGKLWSMGLVVLASTMMCLLFVVRGLLAVPVEGSSVLFMFGAGLDILAMTCLGLFLATVAGSMPQFALLVMMVLMPLQLLSGGVTPRENMPEIIQAIMYAAPNTHFVILAQAVLFRGAGLATVWPQLVALVAIAGMLFAFSLQRFRRFLR